MTAPERGNLNTHCKWIVGRADTVVRIDVEDLMLADGFIAVRAHCYEAKSAQTRMGKPRMCRYWTTRSGAVCASTPRN